MCLAAAAGRHGIDGRFDHRLNPDGDRIDAQIARNNARQVEQIFNEPGLRPAGAFDSCHSFGRLRVVEFPALPASLAQPSTAFTGVRSSCDTFARN